MFSVPTSPLTTKARVRPGNTQAHKKMMSPGISPGGHHRQSDRQRPALWLGRSTLLLVVTFFGRESGIVRVGLQAGDLVDQQAVEALGQDVGQ